MNKVRTILLTLLALVPIALGLTVVNLGSQDWRTASREPVGLAPDPATTPEAVVQVYAARAFDWRGIAGVHSWIAAKAAGAPGFTVYEVSGWRLRRSGTSVTVSDRPPDARWFGNAPTLLADLRGEAAEAAIPGIEKGISDYPFAGEYRVWPGPNSNTFTAYVLRHAPELRVDLPPTAIGKDYLGGQLVAAAPSGTGFQFNVGGVAGILVAIEEGFEINLLGATFGIDPLGLSLKVPFIGRIGALVSGLLLAAAMGAWVFAFRR